MAEPNAAMRMLTPQQAEQHARETMTTLLATPQFRGLQLPNEGRDIIDSVARDARTRGTMSVGAVETRVLTRLRAVVRSSQAPQEIPLTITATEARGQGAEDLRTQGAANISQQVQASRQQLRALRTRLDSLERATAGARTEWLAEKSMGLLSVARGALAPLAGTVGERQGEILVQGANRLGGEYREAHDRASTAMRRMYGAYGEAMSALNAFEQAGQSGDPAQIAAASRRVETAFRALEPAVRDFQSAAAPLARMNTEFAHAFTANVMFVYETAVVVGTAGLASALGHRVSHSLTHGAEKMIGLVGEEALGEGATRLATQGTRAVAEFGVGVAEKTGHHYAVAKAAHEGEALAENTSHSASDAPRIAHAIN